MDDALISLAEFVRWNFGYRNLLFIPLIEIGLICLFFRKNFWENIIIVFGVVNLLILFLLFLFSNYISVTEYMQKYPDGDPHFLEIDIFEMLKFAFYVNGFTLPLVIIYFFMKHFLFGIEYPLRWLFSVVVAALSIVGWFFLVAVGSDGKNCDIFDHYAEREECRRW